MQTFVADNTSDLSDVEQYIAKYDLDKRDRLETIRNLTKKRYPNSFERIYFGMPTVDLDKRIILQYVAYKRHISLIIGNDTREKLQDKYPEYNYTDYTVVFKDKDPLPYEFLVEIIDQLEAAYREIKPFHEEK